jgi:multiple sugar transport system substrate-binding protein
MFIQHQLAEPTQKALAVKLSLTSTLLSIYDDADVLKANPFFAKLKPVFQSAQPRPVTPFYPDVSNAIQLRIHNALTGQATPSAALAGLTSDLQAIVNK